MSGHWTFVGAGNMAASLVGGLLAGGRDTASVALVDPDAATRERAAARFGVAAHAHVGDVRPPAGATERGYVVAVKPDIVERACRDIADATPSGGSGEAPPLTVSVAAGVRLDALAAWLPAGSPIVRCMPNTPALLGLGVSALHANARCGEPELRRAEALLGAVGTTVRVEREDLLDVVTATSGSGPAYVFYLVEQMEAAATALGLDATTARTLAIETAFGAASMLRAGEHPPAELRRRVTSKGGTTAAALAAFDEADLAGTVLAAMRAARERAVELGDAHAAPPGEGHAKERP